MRAYRFLFDQSTGQYKGVTRDKSETNATHEPPIFSYGHQTVWDFKSEWRLVENEMFYMQVSEFGHMKLQDLVTLEAVTSLDQRVAKALDNVLSEQLKARETVLFSIQESVKANHHHSRQVLKSQALNYESLLNILERNMEQLRELNYRVTVLQTRLENTFITRLKNQLIKVWMWLS